MKKNHIEKTFLSGILAMGLLSGCIGSADHIVEIDQLKKDTTLILDTDVQTSPSCKFGITYTFIKSSDKNDSVVNRINASIQDLISNGRIKEAEAGTFNEKLASIYLKNYDKDVRNLYETDKRNKIAADEIPAWYSYEYNIDTNITRGKDECWNFTSEEYQYTGGAHPNTFSKMINFDALTGKAIEKEDIFKEGSDKAICDIILKYLIEEANYRLETDTIGDIKDLQKLGLLHDQELFIPKNFLLDRDQIVFHYNRYEIAPYVFGDFDVAIPYAELKQYLMTK